MRERFLSDVFQAVEWEHADEIPDGVRVHPHKPLLRGIPDLIATLVAIPAVLILVANARMGRATTAAIVYGLCLILLFGVSAIYHVPPWSARARVRLQRVDFSTIYLAIGGSYTPIALLIPDRDISNVLLWVSWAGAAIGILKNMVWPRAPRLFNTVIYIALGWAVVPFIPEVHALLGLIGIGLLVTGGVLYTFGAFIYARRWPDPRPTVFGYHEVFHLFVIAAGTSHFIAMWRIIV